MTDDYLAAFKGDLHADQILAIRSQKQQILKDECYNKYRDALEFTKDFLPSIQEFNRPIIQIGKKSDLDQEQFERLRSSLQSFIPWKKGPFDFFEIEVDSEWRSDLKWQRIVKAKSRLNGQRVADIGCANGYFMFRMLAESPKLVVGFEPFVKNFYEFQMIQNWVRSDILKFELLGVEHIDLYPEFFDTVFCLGILYHHTDPIGLLRKIRSAMKKNGELYIDCQCIAGLDQVALLPKGKYAGARGIWQVPTAACLENWLSRTNFRKCEIFYNERLTSEEQRTTDWAPIKSLNDFLDPTDCDLTIEGYPAPRRVYVRCLK